MEVTILKNCAYGKKNEIKTLDMPKEKIDTLVKYKYLKVNKKPAEPKTESKAKK
jgi:uncharacterized protein YfeS